MPKAKRPKRVGKYVGDPAPKGADTALTFNAPEPEPSGLEGAPSEFKPEYIDIIKMACSLGATDAEIAERLGVTDRTIRNWRVRYPELAEAMRIGKGYTDERAVRVLYTRAMGYNYQSEKIFCTNGHVTRVPCVERVEPDPACLFFWLKNRLPNEWRDRRELTGKDGDPLAMPTIQIVRYDDSGSEGNGSPAAS